ncbi:MAG: hypothetical protein ACE5K2_04510 [Candidatus Zixiibacteriota bacterium]
MNHKIQNKKYLWSLPGIVLFLVSGCFLFSGTWVIIYEVDQADIQTEQGFYKFTVDLTEEEIWQDHKDDIDDIADVSITFNLANHDSADTATGRVYVSSDTNLTTPAEVESLATIILGGISVAPGDTLQMTMAHYYDILQNFDTLKDLVKSGVFTAYAIVPNTLYVEFFDVVVVVTISGGL